MLKIKDYVKATSLEQAYELNQKKNNVILGGMLWLKLQDKNVGCAIDLSGLGLDEIVETREEFKLGAMVSLRQLEQHPGLHQYTQGGIKDALKHLVGVQFRNCATIGGSLAGRFGFSDIFPLLLVMDSYVELYPTGMVPMEQFMQDGPGKDIVVNIIIKKTAIKMAYRCQRNTQTDFPVLNCAVACKDNTYVCAVGARPARAVVIKDEQGILQKGITEESAKAFAAYVQEQVVTGSNMRAGAEYRKMLVEVLTRRAALSLEGK